MKTKWLTVNGFDILSQITAKNCPINKTVEIKSEQLNLIGSANSAIDKVVKTIQNTFRSAFVGLSRRISIIEISVYIAKHIFNLTSLNPKRNYPCVMIEKNDEVFFLVGFVELCATNLNNKSIQFLMNIVKSAHFFQHFFFTFF